MTPTWKQVLKLREGDNVSGEDCPENVNTESNQENSTEILFENSGKPSLILFRTVLPGSNSIADVLWRFCNIFIKRLCY